MDIVKMSTDWAKAEVFSGKIVWLFSVVYIVTAIGFWYFGRTTMAKAFVLPFLIAGVFLVAIGAGLFFTNKPRIERFQKEYHQNPNAFVHQEIQRTAESKKQLTLVFRILPVIIIVAALIILLLPDSTYWRAIGITIIATAAFLMVVDSNTDSRNSIYHSQLSSLKP
jgi:ABC-2 type transport system permease protein